MICVPITATTIEDAEAEIEQANKVADAIELRLDYIKEIDTEKMHALLKRCRKKTIVTVRSKKEKGKFTGSEKQRIMLLRKALEFGADYIDVEFGIKPATLKSLAKKKGHTKIILSHHDFSSTPRIEELRKLYAKMREVEEADVLKIVTYARNINDNATVLELLKEARKDKVKIAAFAMGLLGRDSRILGLPLGSYFAFASLAPGKESAEGQITIEQMKKIYQGLKFMIGGI
jgi:3-dehydroquinate dehydratase type I